MSAVAAPITIPHPPVRQDTNVLLAEEMRRCYDDPVRFVQVAYPWGEPGALAAHDGPDVWQMDALCYIRDQVREHRFDGVHPVLPIRIAVPSGHGTGKGALAAWLVDWILSTRPGSRGSITANTAQQLARKTWATIQQWTKLCITKHWFEGTGELIWFKGRKEDWFAAALTCAPENAEAFQGQHAPSATSFYILDECSNIASTIWQAAEGGLTDGEPMIFAFGQPTRADGEFYDVTSGAKRDRWHQIPVDSRDAKMTNKAIIAEWLEDYGEDSDFFRVRVRGLPPQSGELQFIPSQSVYDAQKRDVQVLLDEPLVMGIDYARGGTDKTVIRFRRGLDARTIKPVKIPGEKCRDSMLVATKIADLIAHHKPAAVFGDATGGSIGGPINDRLRQLGFKVIDVQYGGQSPDKHYANMRSYIWSKYRDWLERGAIDKDRELEQDSVAPGSRHDKHDRVLLESKDDMKKRGLDSPDDADALANTFAAPVVAKYRPTTPPIQPRPWS